MGGQACVLYGAAEFSRDLDLCVLAEPENLENLVRAMATLEARSIAVPDLDRAHLDRGHAVHFRCGREDVAGLRVDIMSRMRGVDGFEELWRRRTTVHDESGEIDVLSLPDLVNAKKTQRDKDWPMIRRLLEQEFYRNLQPSEAQLDFLLRELRTAELLLELCAGHTAAATRQSRPAVDAALRGELDLTRTLLAKEERAERDDDARYWSSLRRELELMRRTRRG